MDFIHIGGGAYSKSSWADYRLLCEKLSGCRVGGLDVLQIVSQTPAFVAACRELSKQMRIAEKLSQGSRFAPPLPVTSAQVAGWPELIARPQGIQEMRSALEQLAAALGDPYNPEPGEFSDLDSKLAEAEAEADETRTSMLLAEAEVLSCAEHMARLAASLRAAIHPTN